MMTVDQIIQSKKEHHYTNEQLSRLSGVPLGTVQKVLSKTTKSPRYETLLALSAVFEKLNKAVVYPIKKGPNADQLGESGFAYQINPYPVAENTHSYDRQGTYTLEDYLTLPDEQRVELIDGVIYDMSSPTSFHQLIGGFIYSQIMQFIREKGGSCIPFIAPMDVQLDCDNRTIVQPDVMIVCDRSKINRQRIFGAPDFVIEVLSPSTKRKDILIKGYKYQNAGVKEYWMINPDSKTVTVYDFREDIDVTTYSFEDNVPILLYDGECVIDFKEIDDYISFIP